MRETVQIRRYKGGEVEDKRDVVVTERVVSLVINGETILRHSMSPALYREFATGFLLTSGMVATPGDIVDVVAESDRIYVSAKNLRVHDALIKGASGGFSPRDVVEIEGFPEPQSLEFDDLIPLFERFSRQSTIFKQTGGTHSAAISDGREILCFAEDIGRHNAMDKAVGLCVLDQRNLSRLALLTSGRISSEIVNKAIHARIPVIISHSAPTSLAIRKADQFGMTLIGFLRGDRFNIYS